MTKLTFKDAIATFRAQEEPESVLLLIGRDPTSNGLRKVFLAWKQCHPARSPKAPRELEDGPDLWGRLWNGIEIDHAELQRITGLSTYAAKLLDILRGNRLIYPDGTVSEIATQALRRMAKSALKL